MGQPTTATVRSTVKKVSETSSRRCFIRAKPGNVTCATGSTIALLGSSLNRYASE